MTRGHEGALQGHEGARVTRGHEGARVTRGHEGA